MRRFNYTGRYRIKHGDLLVTLYPGPDGLEFEAVVDLGRIARQAPSKDARIVLEAYSRTKHERFDLGTLDEPVNGQRHRLVTFGKDENVMFRLKVVDARGEVGRIVALADRISPATPEESHQRSLLPVSVETLDNVVFRVDFPDDGFPTLVLNESLDRLLDQGIKSVARNPLFIALVLPEVVRQVLTRILVIDGNTSDEDDPSSAAGKWKAVGRSLNPDPIPQLEDEDSTEVLDWIELAVARIGQDLMVLRRFEQGMRE